MMQIITSFKNKIALAKQQAQLKIAKTYIPGHWPVWSPDGNELMFISSLSRVGDSGGPLTIWTFDLKDHTLKQPILRYGMIRAAWSPDKRLIAFEDHNNIYIYDRKTKRLHPLFSKGGTGNGRYPTWGPDSRSLAFSSYRNGRIDVYVAQLDLKSDQIRKSYKKITSFSVPGNNMHPAWSQNGKWIAFAHQVRFSKSTITNEIFLVHPDGSGLKKICRLPPYSMVERINWIPDKSKLIVDRITNSSGTVGITNEPPENLPDWEGWFNEGGQAGAAITKYGGYYKKGQDGKYLVFHFPTDEKGRYLPWKPELIVDTKTGKLKPFKLPYDDWPYTKYPKSATQIAPSPNGKRMAFVTESTDGQTISIWVANIDGSDPEELKVKWPSPKPSVPIVTRVGPGFSIPLIKILGDPISIDAYIFHPLGWDGIKKVTFHLSKIDDDSKDIALSYKKSAQQFSLMVNENAASKPINSKSLDSVTQDGITMFGTDSLVEPDKHGGRGQVSFKADNDNLVGEWDISIEVTTKADKKYTTDHVGVIKLKKQWFG